MARVGGHSRRPVDLELGGLAITTAAPASGSTNTARRAWLLPAAGLVIVAAAAWLVLRPSGTGFSDDPRAERVAFARRGGDVLILYRRCGEQDLVPYVDAAEGVDGGRHEWEVAAESRHADEATWVARRNAVGEADPPPDAYEGELPPAAEVTLDVHVYAASIDDRWHVRVDALRVRDLPEVDVDGFDVATAAGVTTSHGDWRARAGVAC